MGNDGYYRSKGRALGSPKLIGAEIAAALRREFLEYRKEMRGQFTQIIKLSL